MPAAWNPFTTEELEEMERCKMRIALQLLMACAIAHNIVEVLDSRMPSTKEVTA